MLLALQMNMLLTGGEDPPEGVAGYINGTLLDANGRVETVFLGPSEALPVGAKLIEGFAHDAQGRLYLSTAADVTRLLDGRAVRDDGVLLVRFEGEEAKQVDGFTTSNRNEVVVVETNPDKFIAGFGADTENRLCVTTL